MDYEESVNFLSKDERWSPLSKFTQNVNNLSQNEIIQSLKDAGRYDDLEIQSFTEYGENEIDFIDICITLARANEDKTVEFFVHRKGVVSD